MMSKEQNDLLTQTGPGALVVVTHQVVIQALAGVGAASAEAVVVRPGADGKYQAVASIAP